MRSVFRDPAVRGAQCTSAIAGRTKKMASIKKKQSSSREPSNLRERILRAASELFAEKGYAATSVREIASLAGCTKPALYYYFHGKEALFLETLRFESDWLAETMAEVVNVEQPMRDRLIGGMQLFLDQFSKNARGMRLLMRAELWPDEGQPEYDFESLRKRLFDMIDIILEVGVEEGTVRADIDREDAAYALVGIFGERLQQWLRGEALPENFPQRAVDLFLYGVAKEREA